jgi:hypothetical protein
MSAIVDSNVTTALTALILYVVGTESVQGFAITLLIGLVASMVTAVFVHAHVFPRVGEAASTHDDAQAFHHPAVRERALRLHQGATMGVCGDGRSHRAGPDHAGGNGRQLQHRVHGGAMMHVRTVAPVRRRSCARRSNGAA